MNSAVVLLAASAGFLAGFYVANRRPVRWAIREQEYRRGWIDGLASRENGHET